MGDTKSPHQRRRNTGRLSRFFGIIAFAALALLLSCSISLNHLTFPESQRQTPIPRSPQPSHVTILIPSDNDHHERFRTQFAAVKCFAEKHNFSVLHGDPNIPECIHIRNIMFRKHCLVREWLSKQPPEAVAVVLDADVIPTSLNISMERFFLPSDLVFYERSWNYEIAACNYIARNTPFTRSFLKYWSSFESIEPPGFSSYDNGAIHQALLDFLGYSGREKCLALYRNLTAPVTNLFPYYKFVACARALLGPPQTYSIGGIGSISIFPRMFGFGLDAAVHGMNGRQNLHPFHHAVKTDEWQKTYIDYKYGSSIENCPMFSTNNTVSDEAFASHLRSSYEYTHMNTFKEAQVVPRFEVSDWSCFDRLWCPPIPDTSRVFPLGLTGSASSNLTEFIYERPAVDKLNPLLEGLSN